MNIKNIVGKTIAYGLMTLLVILVILNIFSENQSNIISKIENDRRAVALYEQKKVDAYERMNTNKLKLTAETCKDQIAKGTPENCTQDFM